MSTPILTLRAGFALAGLSARDLWLSYLALGGTGPFADVSDALENGAATDEEHNLIAQALNEHLLDLGFDFPVEYRSIPPRDADEPNAGHD